MATLDQLQQLQDMLSHDEPPLVLFCPFCGQATPVVDIRDMTETMVLSEHVDIPADWGSRQCVGSLYEIAWPTDMG